jgi:hypothetical protein
MRLIVPSSIRSSETYVHTLLTLNSTDNLYWLSPNPWGHLAPAGGCQAMSDEVDIFSKFVEILTAGNKILSTWYHNFVLTTFVRTKLKVAANKSPKSKADRVCNRCLEQAYSCHAPGHTHRRGGSKTNRVTRLGDFLLIVRLFTLGRFFNDKSSPIFLLLFPSVIVM